MLTNTDANRSTGLCAVRDLYFACYCLAKGLELRATERNAQGWTIFYFDVTPMVGMFQEWTNGEALVSAHRFRAALQTLRSISRPALGQNA